MSVLVIILTVLAAITLVPVCVVAVESIAATVAAGRGGDAKRQAGGVRSCMAIIVPAHNEEASIAGTVTHLREHMRAGDRLLVVADNCSDRTADLASDEGAEVLERFNDNEHGKGYALAAGVDVLRAESPDVVVVVDADCRVDGDGIDALVAQVMRSGVPAQAAYVMTLPDRPTPRDAVSSFAFLFKNVVRPRGLKALGLPCLLTGTGMAFPWPVIARARLATGDIVEDMRIGLEMAIAGSPPMFCPTARVRSTLPGQRFAAASQRTRWEHGHLMTLLSFVPRLTWHALTRLRPKLLALAAELGVPPLSLLVAWMIVLVLAAGLLAAFGESTLPLLLAGAAWMLLVFVVMLGWWKFGRETTSLRLLLTAPLYMLWKLPMYARFLIKPQRYWVRTEREGGADPGAPRTNESGSA
jgi:cellulose synthase/poly-beta-1,6-N-acetylglucosamine synthase-like glycosyltransferase